MKNYFKLSVITTIIAYLVTAFIKWDIWWVSKIPNYGQIDRGGIIAIFLMKELVTAMIWNLGLKNAFHNNKTK